MSCHYSRNWFCSRFSDATRSQLCAHCSIRKYAQGQHLSETYFSDIMTLVLDGLLVKMEVDSDSQKMTASGFGVSGALFSIGDLFTMPQRFTDTDRRNICVTDCVTACFDMPFVHTMFETNLEFVKLCFENVYLFCLKEKTAMMRDIGRGNVYSAVRYLVSFCRDHDIPQLTHEQIAMLCTRSRPIVTNTLHDLIRSEPDLFIPLNGGAGTTS